MFSPVRRAVSAPTVAALVSAGAVLAPWFVAPTPADAALSFRQKAVQVAAAQKGDPYRYGAVGPNSFDCSGLILYAYKKAGRSLVHNAEGQYNQTAHIAKSQKQPGDLIFYTSNGRASGISHVALYAGNGYTWVARKSGTTVTKQKIYSSGYLVGRVR